MKIKLFFLVLITTAAWDAKAADYNAIVAKDGSGEYKTVQQAIDAAPNGLIAPYKILIKKGRYTEHLTIPASKSFIELVGEDVSSTYLAYADGKGGTSTLTIDANDCLLVNLTLENTQGQIADGPQSLAVRTNGDRITFFNCRFTSGQDTVLVNSNGKRIYFSNCYIDGNTDFIFGPAIAVFDKCVIYCRDRVDFGKGGYLTAASTPAGQTYGLVFRDCLLPDNHGITHYTLGRPWQNDGGTEKAGRTRAANKVVFLNTRMGQSIAPAGWSVWDAGTVTDVINYAEYRSTDINGKRVDLSNRVSWCKQLSPVGAKLYYDNAVLFGNWNPFKVWADLHNAPDKCSLAIANAAARMIGDDIYLQFNSCWPQSGVTYILYKNGAATGKLITKTNSIAAYQFRINEPDINHTDQYLIKASKTKTIVLTDTLVVTTASILRKKNGKK